MPDYSTSPTPPTHPSAPQRLQVRLPILQSLGVSWVSTIVRPNHAPARNRKSASKRHAHILKHLIITLLLVYNGFYAVVGFSLETKRYVNLHGFTSL